MRRRWLLVAGIGVVLLVQATGGFSAATLDRPFSVSVVDGPDGLLGVETEGPIELDNGNNEDVALLTLDNQFGDVALDQVDVDVTGDTEGTPPVITNVSSPSALAASGPGSSGVVAADVTCGSNGNGNGGAAGNAETFAVQVSVSGDGVSVELTEDVTVSCTGDSPANGNGGGNSSPA